MPLASSNDNRQIRVYSIIAVLLIAGGVLLSRYFAPGRQVPELNSNYNAAQIGVETDQASPGAALDATRVVEKVGPSVAQINTQTEQVIYDYFRRPYLSESQGLGSGVVINENGYILTNNHVIANASTIEVVLPGREPTKAKLVGADAQTDLAVIQIEATNLPVAEIGNSQAVKVGQPVVAIGNPYGFDNTVTTGVISAKNRSLALDENTWLEGLIQTDASINPGNSGGPLMDASGRVIGINTAIIEQAQGIGFSIPIHLAMEVVDDLVQHGKVLRLGIFAETLTPEMATQLEWYTNMDIPEVSGAIVLEVQPGTPAERSKIRAGDVIIELNGQKISTRDELVSIAGDLKYQDPVTLTVYRGDQRIQLETVMR